jgi:hypothetical protein
LREQEIKLFSVFVFQYVEVPIDVDMNSQGVSKEVVRIDGSQSRVLQVVNDDEMIQVHVLDESNHTVRVLNMDQHGIFSHSHS